jgi:hypothetical protein
MLCHNAYGNLHCRPRWLTRPEDLHQPLIPDGEHTNKEGTSKAREMHVSQSSLNSNMRNQGRYFA